MSDTPPALVHEAIETTGRFANERYRGATMPPPETVRDPDERGSMHVHRTIRVADARASDDCPSLSHSGFTLVNDPIRTSVSRDRNATEAEFLGKCLRLCKDLTGCRAARVIQYQYRSERPGRPAKLGKVRVDGYETLFHVDLTPYSELRLDFASNGRHFQIYNFWRSCRQDRSIEYMPLALCDMRSVRPHEMVFAEFFSRRQPPARGYGYRLIHSPSQCWSYFPSMTPDEVIVHKQYDTMEMCPSSRGVFHGAVRDPNTPRHAPLRETIEVRILASFHDETDKLARVQRFQSEIRTAS